MRLVQNYITEETFNSIPDIKVEEIGRLQFRCRFKAGTDEDHALFVADNDSRETQETWEACHAEGVRSRKVTKELPPAVQELHDQSLTQGRDVLSQANDEDKENWLAKDGTDWSGAFGQDPAQYVDNNMPRHYSDSDYPQRAASKSGDQEAGLNENMSTNGTDYDDDDYTDSDSDSDLGVVDATSSRGTKNDNTDFDGTMDDNGQNGSSHANNPIGQAKEYNENKKGLHRKQRGLMQWKPMRNLQFAKDEAKFAVRRTLKKGSLSGRQPDVETETG